jgi:hypothetical protein
VQEGVVTDRPDDPEARQRLAHILDNFAELYRAAGRFADATPPRRRALELVDGLARALPNDPACRKEQARLAHGLAVLLLRQGQSAEAVALLRDRLAARPRQGDAILGDADYRRLLLGQYSRLAEGLLLGGQPKAAAEALVEFTATRPALWTDTYAAATYLVRCVAALRQGGGPAGDEAAVADCYARLALRWLREAAAGAPADQRAAMAAELTTGPAVAVLGGHEDFKALVRTLQQGRAPSLPSP